MRASAPVRPNRPVGGTDSRGEESPEVGLPQFVGCITLGMNGSRLFGVAGRPGTRPRVPSGSRRIPVLCTFGCRVRVCWASLDVRGSPRASLVEQSTSRAPRGSAGRTLGGLRSDSSLVRLPSPGSVGFCADLSMSASVAVGLVAVGRVSAVACSGFRGVRLPRGPLRRAVSRAWVARCICCDVLSGRCSFGVIGGSSSGRGFGRGRAETGFGCESFPFGPFLGAVAWVVLQSRVRPADIQEGSLSVLLGGP